MKNQEYYDKLYEFAKNYAKGEGLENALGGWEDMSDAYIEGAIHQRNSVWHEVSKEIPTRFGEYVIVLCKNKNKPDGIFLADMIQCWEGKWEPRENYEDPVMWCYLDDILPL